jgi:phosphate-selective porin OprO/OprP
MFSMSLGSLGLSAKLVCGWIVAFFCCAIVWAQDLPTDKPWDGSRQMLPQVPGHLVRHAAVFRESGTLTSQTRESDSDAEVDVDPPADVNSDLDTRLRALEQTVGDLSNVEAESLDETVISRLQQLEQVLPDVEIDGRFMEALARTANRVMNGRLQLDGWEFPESSHGINAIENGEPNSDPENRLLVRRARIGVNGTIPPENMSYRLELEFSGQDGGRIRDAWLGWDDLPLLNTLRIGNQKRPYGLDHLNSSNFMTFLERPFVIDAFNRDNRRLGLASYGASDDRVWNWRLGTFNQVLLQDTNDIVGDNPQMEFTGRLASTCWYDEASDGRGYAHFAVAGSLAYPDGSSPENQAQFQSRPEARTQTNWLDTGQIAGANAYQLLAAESVFNVGSLQLVGEWMHIRVQRERNFGPDVGLHGGYVSLSYFLTGEHIPWNRELGVIGRINPIENFFFVDTCDGGRARGLGAWQIALRLSRADFNDSNIFGGIGENLTLALNWYWNAHSRLQINYIFGHVDNRRTTLTDGSTPIVSGDYQIIGTRFMIDF